MPRCECEVVQRRHVDRLEQSNCINGRPVLLRQVLQMILTPGLQFPR